MGRRDRDPFVNMPVWWAMAVSKAFKSPNLIVAVELLRRQFETGKMTFPLSNGRLAKAGVSREIKRRALRDLERAKLITVERPANKNPIVTLVLL